MKSLREQYEESQQTAFMREVNEAMRADRAKNLWNRYKYWICLVAGLAVAATASYNISRIRKRNIGLQEAAGFERIMALPAKDRPTAMSDFAAGAEYGYRDVAYANLYSMRLEGGDVPGAMDALRAAVAGATNPAHRNIALIKLASLPGFADYSDSVAYFKRLADIRPREPLYYSARLVMASDYARLGNFDAAKPILAEIDGSDRAPTGLRTLAAEISGYIRSAEKK